MRRLSNVVSGLIYQFAYLGVLIRPDGDKTREIRRRIKAGSRCYFGLLRHRSSKLLSKTTKCKIYKTLIRPVLTYSCGQWILKKSGENLILVFERKVLRTIFGAVREGERWKPRYNFELQ